MNRLALLGLTIALSVRSAQAETVATVDYLKQVKPLLAARCFACHGALKQEAGLRLDTAEAIRRGGDSGSAVMTSAANDSLLLARIVATNLDERMPPEGEGSALKAEEVALLRAWIAAGATGPNDEQPEADPREHWAFRAPVRAPVPVVQNTAWVRNPIDAFLAAEQERHGLTPQPPVSRSLLLRRVYLDLIGLPPTNAELAAFLADESPDAYERVVDRLLADPQYGARWGRHWMDVWRYSDWSGLGEDLRVSQKHMWHWRDWIIESLNADVSYDEVIRQMLAADELYPNDLEKIRATGYLARNYYKFNRNTWMEQVVEHTAKSFLGVTLNCSRCHDHKYDPFTQKDFYRFRAYFEPYQVRLDQLPGTADYERDGLPRVFDCNLDAPTYLYVRGEETAPVKDESLAPGLPAVLTTSEMEITPVVLPATAHQPGLQPWVLKNLLKATDAAAAKARKQLADAQAAMQDAEKSQAKTAPLALVAAKKAVAAAELEAKALHARAAADKAQQAGPKAAAKKAALAASLAERVAENAKASLAVAEGELAVATAKPSGQQVAEGALKKAQAALEKSNELLAQAADGKYTPLTGSLKALEAVTETEESRRKAFPTTSSGRRTALARQLTDRSNPLTARVAVNHIWMRHMGKPLVPTVFDFGRNGTPPTHQALLDWLAVEFMDGPVKSQTRGPAAMWSMKHLHRLIVTSNAYRMSSSTAGSADNLARDVDNHYYWRMNTVRLEAQIVRDSLLHLSGRLDPALGGPSLDSLQQEKTTRRSVYFVHAAREPNRFLVMFDDAKVTECYRREQSIVPQQALTLANSKQALLAAATIADNLRKQPENRDEEAFVRAAFLTVLADQPTDDELTACREALAAWRTMTPPPANSDAARSNLVHALLNHNNFITVK